MLVVLLLTFASRCESNTVDDPIAITRVTIIDVARARRLGPATLLVANGHISAIGSSNSFSVPKGVREFDGHGAYLVPGLIDAHVHLFNNSSHRPPNTWTFPLFVANGVTGVREMHASIEQLVQVSRWRKEILEGKLVAPRILGAGVAVAGSDADDVRWQVRHAVRSGATFIKVFSEIPSSSWQEAINEAHIQNVSIAGHDPVSIAAVAAAKTGQRTDEHLMQIYEACSGVEGQMLSARSSEDGLAATKLRDDQEREVLENFDSLRCASISSALARTGQIQVPTLVLSYNEAFPPRDFSSDARRSKLREDERQRWQAILGDTEERDSQLDILRWKTSCAIVRALNEADVPILAGTDTPMPLNYPGYSLHDEIELLANCGLTSAQALQAATTRPASLLGVAGQVGSIDVGKRADLVLLDADPLLDVRNLRRIRAVILGGALLDRSSLDAMLR